jgi:hypothetical protein
MAKYRFVGVTRTTFPSIVIDTDTGHHTLEVDPGDIVDLATDPHHPELVAVKAPRAPKAVKASAKRPATPPPPMPSASAGDTTEE